MALETKLLQKMNQSLLMTPQLQQAIKLLQLGRLDYIEAIQEEMMENPLLEEQKENEAQAASEAAGQEQQGEQPTTLVFEDDGDVTPPTEPEAKVDWEGYLESFTDYSGTATPRGLIDFDDRPQLEATASRAENLTDHLAAQLRFSDFDELQMQIALYIVGNLDKDGYLCVTWEEIASACSCSVDEVAQVIAGVQQLDPPGVAARDLRECLAIQLECQGKAESLEARIVNHHLDKLERRRFDLIAKAEGVEVEQVYKAVTAIRELEPRPGRPFGDETARYIVPDIYVSKVGSEYVITLNDDGMPRLHISPYYLQILKSQSEGQVDKAYLTDRLKAASWLIRSMIQRQQTIFKVTESIVKFQKEFLDHGISRLKPLVLKDVAEDIHMHESTVSRVTTNKFVHTPQGVFELKFFFTTGIKTAEGDVSSSSIKERIKGIIAAEASDNPISDQGIVELLQKEHIEIARRTVAKYREGLGIESSSRRKKLF